MPSIAVYDVSDPHHKEGNAFGLDASHPGEEGLLPSAVITNACPPL